MNGVGLHSIDRELALYVLNLCLVCSSNLSCNEVASFSGHENDTWRPKTQNFREVGKINEARFPKRIVQESSGNNQRRKMVHSCLASFWLVPTRTLKYTSNTPQVLSEPYVCLNLQKQYWTPAVYQLTFTNNSYHAAIVKNFRRRRC